MSLSLPSRPPVLWAVRILSFSAMSICFWLLGRKLTGDISSIAGCGGGGDCEQVMGGAWSEWFHIPVTLLAALVHLSVLILTLPSVQRALGRTGDQLLAATGVTLAGAAVYFLTVLYGVIKGHCPWCLGLHLTGLAVAALILSAAVRTQKSGRRGLLEAALLTGLMAVGVLAAGQIWGPKPETHLLTTGSQPAGGSADAAVSPPATAGSPQSRTVTFAGGLSFDTATLPVLGAPNARVVLVEFFDYTCSSCRRLAGDLKALKKKWPDTFGVIALPTPLNRACNPFLKPTVNDHAGACELANLSLALWRAKPAAFPEFHEYLLSVPLPVNQVTIDGARRKADELAGAAAMTAAMDDAWVAKQLKEDIATFAKLTAQSIAMPKLLIHTSVIMHGTARDTGTFIKLMEQQFDLAGTGLPVVAKPK